MSLTLLLTPLKIERKALVEALEAHGLSFTVDHVGLLPIYRNAQYGLIVAQGGHGKVQFGIQAQFLLGSISGIKRIFCVGAAGGLGKELKIGDVVVAEQVVEHDYRVRFFKTELPRHQCDREFNSQLIEFGRDKEFSVYQGVIASGDEDIIDSDRAEEVHQQTQAIAVAWEGAGGARVGTFNKVPYCEIRGITDLPFKEKQIDFNAQILVSMKNISSLLIHALSLKNE